jgi:hypothetical protein
MEQKPPDVLSVGPEWPERALLRARLNEEGHVVATDAWPIPRLDRRSRNEAARVTVRSARTDALVGCDNTAS